MELFSDWLFSDSVESSSWTQPDYDDSKWNLKHYGEFPPYEGQRYYRIHVNATQEALSFSGALLLCLRGRNSSSLYVNGRAIYEHLCAFFSPVTRSTTPVSNHTGPDGIDRNDYFQYSIPVRGLGTSLTLAVQTDSATEQPITDVFDLVAVFLPAHASRLVDGTPKSKHAKDYYSNPLGAAIDANRRSKWMITGNRADFEFTLNNERFEYLNEYAITVDDPHAAHPVGWTVTGCVREGGNVVCEQLDARQEEKWLGAFQTRSFAMNSQGKSYQIYRIDFCGEGSGE